MKHLSCPLLPILDAAVALQAKPQPEVTPQQQAAAATTSAPQAVTERFAPVAVAPTQGVPNDKNTEAVVTWRTQVLALIEKNKRYPEAARSRREQGTAQVSFTLDRKGMVVNARVIQSSGSNALDEEAIALLKRAQPFPLRWGNVPRRIRCRAAADPFHRQIKQTTGRT